MMPQTNHLQVTIDVLTAAVWLHCSQRAHQADTGTAVPVQSLSRAA